MVTIASLLPHPGFVIPSYDEVMAPPRSAGGQSVSWNLADEDLPPGLQDGTGIRVVTVMLRPFGTAARTPGAMTSRSGISESQVRELVAFGRHFPPDPSQHVPAGVSKAVFWAWLNARLGVSNLDVRRAFLMGRPGGD